MTTTAGAESFTRLLLGRFEGKINPRLVGTVERVAAEAGLSDDECGELAAALTRPTLEPVPEHVTPESDATEHAGFEGPSAEFAAILHRTGSNGLAPRVARVDALEVERIAAQLLGAQSSGGRTIAEGRVVTAAIADATLRLSRRNDSPTRDVEYPIHPAALAQLVQDAPSVTAVPRELERVSALVAKYAAAELRASGGAVAGFEQYFDMLGWAGDLAIVSIGIGATPLRQGRLTPGDISPITRAVTEAAQSLPAPAQGISR